MTRDEIIEVLRDVEAALIIAERKIVELDRAKAEIGRLRGALESALTAPAPRVSEAMVETVENAMVGAIIDAGGSIDFKAKPIAHAIVAALSAPAMCIAGYEYVRAAVRNNPMGPEDHKIVCDFIDALSVAPADGWRPIESAPKDTDLILGWWENWPGPSRWRIKIGFAGSTKGGWLDGFAAFYLPLEFLPSPPTAGEG